MLVSRGDHRRSMRIVHLIDSLEVGGTELHVLKLTRALQRRGVPVRVVCIGPTGPLQAEYDGSGVELRFSRVTSFKSLGLLNRLKAIRQAVEDDGTTIVHAHDIYSNVVGGMLARRRNRWRFIASQRWDRPERMVWRLATRAAFARADSITANGPGTADIAAKLAGRRSDRVVSVENFLEAECFDPPGDRLALLRTFAPSVGAEPLVLGYVGRLDALKRVDWLIRALDALRDRELHLVLVVVGDGAERVALETLVRSLGLENRVFFAGARPRLPLPHSVFDIALLASSTEGTPNTLVEAMACGAAVVATAVGGVPSIVEDGHTGVLVSSNDEAAFVRAIAGLVADPVRRHSLAEAAVLRARARWSEATVLPELMSVYSSLWSE